MDSEPSFDESYQLFQTESNHLEDIIENTIEKSDKTIPDIVQIYYQVIKVDSLGKLLKQRFQDKVDPDHHKLLDRIDVVQNIMNFHLDLFCFYLYCVNSVLYLCFLRQRQICIRELITGFTCLRHSVLIK